MLTAQPRHGEQVVQRGSKRGRKEWTAITTDEMMGKLQRDLLKQNSPCLVHPKLKIFQDSPSHRILRHMHETLNIVKNKN